MGGIGIGLGSRVATFVDAGWLLAAAALEVEGVSARHELACDYAGLVGDLERHVDEHSSGMARLRTYWYDAAPGGMPGYEHQRVAGLPYVKLRLGRLSCSGQQKGVDVLIYHDLISLARERVIARAYLVAGDEDLSEGVSEAQKHGVQVVLLGMPMATGQNQSARLVRECDEYQLLPREAWEPHCARRNPDEQPLNQGEVEAVRETAQGFAHQLVVDDPDRVPELLAMFPQLPSDLDIALLVAAEERVGSLRPRPDLKSELRGTFWLALKQPRGERDALIRSGESGEHKG